MAEHYRQNEKISSLKSNYLPLTHISAVEADYCAHQPSSKHIVHKSLSQLCLNAVHCKVDTRTTNNTLLTILSQQQWSHQLTSYLLPIFLSDFSFARVDLVREEQSLLDPLQNNIHEYLKCLHCISMNLIIWEEVM